MGKLKNLKPRLAALPSRIAYIQSPEAREPRVIGRPAWANWYKLARWFSLRQQTFVRDLYTCQWPSCGRVHHDTSQLVADHRLPHRGDERLFWDPANLQTLCAAPCHNKHKQRMEAQMPKGVWT